MISLFIDKYFQLKNTLICDKNNTNYENKCKTFGVFKNTKLKHLVLNQFLFKLKVIAIENEVKDNNSNDNNNINNNLVKENVSQSSDQMLDITSQEYYNQMKTMTVWESIKYLFNRNVDRNDENYKKQFIKEGETGEDRVKLMFSEYLNGEDNPEMRFIVLSLGYGLLIGGLYGGIVSNKTAVEDFIRRHNEFVFRGDFEGKRKIRDTMYLNLVQRGFRWSWRVGLFTFALTSLTTIAIAYRNDIYYKDCMAAGALVCGLWKAKLGLRAAVVSGVLGSIFGAIFASSLKVMLWSMHTTVPEYRHWRHMRYLGHLEVEKYSDGNTEFNWNIEGKDTRKQPNYQNQNTS